MSTAVAASGAQASNPEERTQGSRLSAPTSVGGLVGALSAIAGATTGAVLGWALSPAAMYPFLGPFLGTVVGVAVLGPRRPAAMQEWLGRGLLAAALAGAAGAMLPHGLPILAAWAMCSLAVLLASVAVEQRTVPDWVFRASLSGAVTGVGFFVLLAAGGPPTAARVMLFGAIAGLGGFLAGWLEVPGTAPRGLADTDTTGVEPAAPSIQVDRPSVRTASESSVLSGESAAVGSRAEPVRFASEEEAIRRAAQTLRDMLTGDGEWSAEMLGRLDGLTLRMEEHLERWRPGLIGHEQQTATLAEQLHSDQGVAAATSALPPLVVQQRRKMRQMVDEIEQAAARFSCRLGEVASGLELLALTLRRDRLLSPGETSKVDDLSWVLDALNEATPSSSVDKPSEEPGSGQRPSLEYQTPPASTPESTGEVRGDVGGNPDSGSESA